MARVVGRSGQERTSTARFFVRVAFRIAGLVGIVSCSSILGITAGEPQAGCFDGGGEACEVEGARRCSGTMQQECKVVAGNCRVWSEPEECAAGSICCGAAGAATCVPVSVSNCYGCGTTCIQPTPECLPGPKKCGCNSVSCAAFSQACDTATGACAECTEPAADATEVFVDAQAPTFTIARPRGTQACPFYTISAALDWARGHPSVTTVRVAAGTYSKDEAFPLDVRGLTVLGAGSTTTLVRGQGTFDRTALEGQLAFADMRATIIAGHPTRVTRVEGMTLQRPTELTAMDEKDSALLCDQGNITERSPASVPAANTILRDLVIAKGYARGVVVSNSTKTAAASGCNLKITASALRGGPGQGILASGANRGGTTAAQASRGVAIEIGGPDPADAVVATNYQSSTFSAAGAFVGSIAQLLLERFAVDNSNIGLIIEQESSSGKHPRAEVRRLTVTKGSSVGLWLNCDTRLGVLEDSDLSDVHRATAGGTERGWGLMLSVSDAAYCESGSPGVLRARRNRIVGNDSGIVMTSFNASGATFTAPMDFGTVADPGGNVIRCNSLANGNGHDLRVDNARAAVLSFHGNEWDHAKLGKPMVQTHPSDPASLPNGADVALLLDESNLVLSGATAGEAPCPGGQVAGPAPP